MTAKELIIQSVDSRADEYIAASGRIHDYAELSYEEFQSMGELTALLNKEGFTVETGLVDMPTCFTGKWGSGSQERNHHLLRLPRGGRRRLQAVHGESRPL